MPPLTSTRTLFELRVGSIHTIEVLLQIRSSDINWWNSNYIQHECELYKLIGRRILPKECRDEIETDRARRLRDGEAAEQKKKLQQSSKVDEEDIVVGKRNSTKRNAVSENGRKDTVAGKKRGGGAIGKRESNTSKKPRRQDDTAAKTTTKKQSSKKSSNGAAILASESTKEEKKLKLLRESGTWILGTSIQICYMIEIIDWSSVATLIFRPNDNSSTGNDEIEQQQQSQASSKKDELNHEDDDDGNKMVVVPLASFRTWKKLPKRLVLWVFQFNPNDPTDLRTSTGGGFPRPDLLPIADIFRSTTV